jgi:hypothetical protein
MHTEFIKYLVRIVKIKENEDYSEIDYIIKQIENTENLINRVWLIKALVKMKTES